MSQTRPIEDLFAELIELKTPAEREAYLDEVCGEDSRALRGQLQKLIAAYQQAGSFLQGGKSNEATFAWDHDKLVGSSIGPYKIREQIGDGGMGVVYVAEQERPLRRKVAVKVIKPGMDSKAVLARFDAERNALALMNHPNIAKVFDAGTTEHGHPYFVMELVSGIPITNYCDEHKLSIRERLALFTEVCHAIQHAHQKGVIHRDVKPSNVLVAELDGKPISKVIDFGVAKAIGQNLTDRTVYTSFQSVIGTPLYMSPEQASLSAVDVDTRSDIYSLGVLLYELLAGTTPFDKEALQSAAQDEVLRIIREQEPPKPSTKISTLGKRASSISQGRRTDISGLGRMVRGELDWIVMKALDKERSRRYDSASALADDVRRHLNDEPVLARPDSQTYRMIKFARKNKMSIMTAGMLMCCLLLGTIVSTIFALEAARQRDIARALKWEALQERDNARALELVARRERDNAREILGQLQQEVIERALMLAMAGELSSEHDVMKTAEAAGVPRDWVSTLEGFGHLHRGENELALVKLREAIELQPDNVSAHAMLSLGLMHTGRWDEWHQRITVVCEMEPRREYEDFDELALSYAVFYVDQQQCIERLRPLLRKHPTWILPRARLASALSHLAGRQPERAIALTEEALAEIEIVDRVVEDNAFMLMTRMGIYSSARRILDNHAEIDELADECAAKLEHHPDYVVGSLYRAMHYDWMKQEARAIKAWEDMLQYGHGVSVHWPVAELFRRGHLDTIRKLDARESEARIAKAYVWALSANPSDQKAAVEVFEELRHKCSTWFMRHLLIQIPLLLHRPDQAEQQCREWISEDTASEGLDNELRWEKESIAFLAGGKPLDDTSADPIEQFYAKYQKALLAYSNRNISKAVDHLVDIPPCPHAGFLKAWADAFRSHFAEETRKQ